MYVGYSEAGGEGVAVDNNRVRASAANKPELTHCEFQLELRLQELRSSFIPSYLFTSCMIFQTV